MPFLLGKTITETFLKRVQTTPDVVGFQYKEGASWKEVSFRKFYAEVRIVSFGLMGVGVQPGDRVVILSNTRYHWSLLDMAILGARGVTVPIYPSNTPGDVTYILNHSEAVVVILEDAKQLEKILAIQKDRPDALSRVRKFVILDPTGVGAVPGEIPLIDLRALSDIGTREEARAPQRFDEQLSAAQPEDLFTICYTSGTTGIPKGAMLTHDNLMSVIEDCVALLSKFTKPEAEVTLSFLPFSHILGRVEEMAIYTFGWREAFTESLDKLMTNIGEVRPTVVFAVPRIFEKAHARILGMIEEDSALKRGVFNWATRSGRRYYEAIWKMRSARKAPNVRDIAEYALAQKLVFSKIRERFGGRLRFAVCGGAALPKEIGEFFQIVGIKVLEGYGLTETCAPVAVNTPDDPRFGVVGKPLPEVTIKIAEDGEILIRSRKVFKGYYKMPEETAEVLDDGWFRTGDIGHIDDDGFLKITDRKKDLIITSGGKNVAPQKIESIAKANSLISQFVAYGDGRNYLTALLTLDRELVIRYATENQILFSEYSELIRNPKIIALAQKAVDEINRGLASYETIKKFIILPNEFTVESGELTPSLKVRRAFVNRRYRSELDSMYSEQPARP